MVLPDYLLAIYPKDCSVRANFITSPEGAYHTASGSSRGLGNASDREVLIHLRSLADVVVVGGETARLEGYRPTNRFDTIVITRHPQDFDPALQIWNDGSDQGLEDLIHKLNTESKRVLIEAGPSLLSRFLKLDLVDQLCLSITGYEWDPVRLFKKLFTMRPLALDASMGVDGITFTTWSTSKN